jgi:hypothetical protein
LDRASTGRFELAIPAFALTEPYGTVSHRARERVKIAKSLDLTLDDLARSAVHRSDAYVFAQVVQFLGDVETREYEGLYNAESAILRIARVLPLTTQTLDSAQGHVRSLGLSQADSVILASVVEDLRAKASRDDSVLLSKNVKDFGDPAVLRLIESFRCRYEPSFEAALMSLETS